MGDGSDSGITVPPSWSTEWKETMLNIRARDCNESDHPMSPSANSGQDDKPLKAGSPAAGVNVSLSGAEIGVSPLLAHGGAFGTRFRDAEHYRGEAGPAGRAGKTRGEVNRACLQRLFRLVQRRRGDTGRVRHQQANYHRMEGRVRLHEICGWARGRTSCRRSDRERRRSRSYRDRSSPSPE